MLNGDKFETSDKFHRHLALKPNFLCPQKVALIPYPVDENSILIVFDYRKNRQSGAFSPPRMLGSAAGEWPSAKAMVQ
jgi:hypothetical protein